MSPTGDLLVTPIGGLHVWRWHGTEPVAAHPIGSLLDIPICDMGGTPEALTIKPPSTSIPTPQIQMLWLPAPVHHSVHSIAYRSFAFG